MRSQDQLTQTFSFLALGSTVEFGVRADLASAQRLAQDLQERVAQFESRFSRFLLTSELNRLNLSNGQPFAASKAFVDILVAARTINRQTNGIVNPLVGSALINAGYNQSFEKLVAENPAAAADEPRPAPPFDSVALDERTGTVTLTSGRVLDLGGIGKGYLADQLVPIIQSVTPNFWLSLGGDMVGSGTNDDDEPWSVAVQNPWHLEQNLGTLRMTGPWAVATSGITKRRGTRAGKPWHHLIDPRTGEPADTEVIGATVTAPSAFEAEAFAKTLVILGQEAGLDWLSHQPNCYAILSTRDSVHIADKLKPYFIHA
jgi:FAD:protein FMN transferase